MIKDKLNIFVINTGSTTTKIALFEEDKLVWEHKFTHQTEELSDLKEFDEKVNFRKNIIEKFFKEKSIKPSDIDIFICRGGLIKPVSSGVYDVNEKMLNDLKNATQQHASNLAAVIGYQLSKGLKPVYIADPVVVDEMQDVARYTGHRLFNRQSVFHALNHKALARRYAEKLSKKYEDLNLIIAHLGGGISVGAHYKGRVIDVNQALDGEGPFSPERSGSLPTGELLKKAFSGQYSFDEMKKMIVGKGGLVSYLGTNNVQEIEQNLTNKNKEVLSAMAYQIAKNIGEMAVVLNGKIDAILLTGGVAHSKFITEYIKQKVDFLAPVIIYPGEDEMKALAYNAWLVWRGVIQPKNY